jgi:hypothetical protein
MESHKEGRAHQSNSSGRLNSISLKMLPCVGCSISPLNSGARWFGRMDGRFADDGAPSTN